MKGWGLVKELRKGRKKTGRCSHLLASVWMKYRARGGLYPVCSIVKAVSTQSSIMSLIKTTIVLRSLINGPGSLASNIPELIELDKQGVNLCTETILERNDEILT